MKYNGPKKLGLTTEPPHVSFESTKVNVPDDFQTSDIEYVDSGELKSGDGGKERKSRFTDGSPYVWDDQIKNLRFTDKTQEENRELRKKMRRNIKLRIKREVDEEIDNKLRVKRKSGKTTGALRPKADTGSSKSQSTSRKVLAGLLAGEDDVPPLPEELEEEEEELEEEEEDTDPFHEISEIRFPGEVGPLGDRRLCKIRCIKGKWVGPLCTHDEGEK